MSDRIHAKYRVETPQALEFAAEVIAGEQSSGTFIKVPGETEELKARSRAKIESILPQDTVMTPSLAGSRPKKDQSGPIKYHRGEIEISWPYDNIGANLPTLMSTVCGNLYELGELSGLRLLDIDVPPAFTTRYRGPQFGIEGTRRLTGVYERPIIGTIVKPSVGLTPTQTAELVRELGEAGIDFIKDDELMADPPHSPLAIRVEQVMRVINDLADKTGKKVMYAFNISDEQDAMKRHHDTVLKAGGSCIMISLNSVGLGSTAEMARHTALPIHGHRNGWGMWTRHPYLGMEFSAYQKFWRLAGVDHLHVNGLENKFWEPDESVVRSIKACQTSLLGGYPIMPVISSGQWGGQAPETYRLTKTVDLMYVAGGGIMAHPSGPAAGLRGLQQAWKAAVAGIELSEYAKTHDELRQTIERFGSLR